MLSLLLNKLAVEEGLESCRPDDLAPDDMATSEIRKVKQSGETDSVKGKENEERKGITRPPLNFLTIFKESEIPIDMSSPDKLCAQLHAGVFLKSYSGQSLESTNELMYFVHKKLNKNCFVMFAKKLSVIWGDNANYWRWMKEKPASDGLYPTQLRFGEEEVHVAELVEVCWLEIKGRIWTVDLSPGTLYEIVFVVKIMNRGISRFSLKLTIALPDSTSVTRYEPLKEKPLHTWIEIQVGEFIMSPQNVGNMTFGLEETGGDWKRGLLVKCAIIRPKNE